MRSLGVSLTLAALALSGVPAPAAAQPAAVSGRAASDYDAAGTAAFRTRRNETLRQPDGWLAVAGLTFLQPGANTIGSARENDVPMPAGTPARLGVIDFDGREAWFTPAQGVTFLYNGQSPPAGRVALRLADSATRRPADRVTAGEASFHLHYSGPRLAIRMRDPNSALRRDFTGPKWYDVDPAWRVTGRWIPKPASKVPVQTILGDIEEYTSVGEVDAVIAGTPVRLVALGTERLWFIFSDQSSVGGESYRIRFLYTDPVAADGMVTLDFNRAENPPCAYNPHTTCPLPPRQNRLGVAIPAGEKAYR